MRIYYDLHIHSCLSPCGDADMTPCNIVNMARLAGLSAIADRSQRVRKLSGRPRSGEGNRAYCTAGDGAVHIGRGACGLPVSHA